jgi:uncharacterized heparinase superfamily protein
MKKLFLLFNTLRYLKWQQIYFRLVRKLIKPNITERFQGSKPQVSKAWKHLTLYEEKIDKYLNANFLNHSKKLDREINWNSNSPSKLWIYNLHYFEDLLSENAHEKNDVHRQLLDRWVDENPVGRGNGWEPYPTSLRVVNILKAWLGGLELDEKLLSSVFAQASFLSNDLEKHLLGNHYFANLKALLFAGTVFNHVSWNEIAEQGLLIEIPEQILQDGANFELSPMYHSLILVDMLDMFNLSMAYPTQMSEQLVSLLEEYIPKMLVFMEAMAHPDGGVSFFNDSADGIAPTKVKIESYAQKLGFEISPLDCSNLRCIDNSSSGYICAIAAGNKLIFDASPVGPDYLPAHAHADTLSFELSIHTQRVFVNSGTSQYGLNSRRLNQRKTRAHNTVEVDYKDSSQVWSGFRVASRARILSRFAKLTRDQSIVLQASHNGYKSLFGGCLHTRKLIFSQDRLVVSDELHGPFRHAKSRFYFHPDLTLSLERHLLRVKGPQFTLDCDLTGKVASLVNSFWYPKFGVEIPNKVLEITFKTSQLEIEFTWTNN